MWINVALIMICLLDLQMELRQAFVWTCSFLVTTVSAGFCVSEPLLCSECKDLAECSTIYSAHVIPQNLSTSTQRLHVTYSGNESLGLSAGMFSRYPDLNDIAIHGNPHITFLGPAIFYHIRKLKWLAITGTGIATLPSQMIPADSLIMTLDLKHNSLTDIPYHLFKDLPELSNFSLGFNNIVAPNCTSIGTGFTMLPKLTILDLSNFHLLNTCKTEVKADFFEPIEKTVEHLTLATTNVYEGSQQLFQKFSNIQTLDISDAKRFSECPSKAQDLFDHLPQSLHTLIFKRWRTDLEMKPGCGLSNVTIASLRQLQNLTKLDMEYCDGMFGHKLEKSVFAGFTKLLELDISWGRFSSVEKYVFDGCPNLRFINLGGNPLGIRPIRLFSNRSASKLEILDRRRNSIFSDYSIDFHASNMTHDAPISTLDFSVNYIKYTPFFVSNQTPIISLKTICMDDNVLEDLNSGGNLGTQCKYLPNLTTLSLLNNKIENAAGLCKSITTLRLGNNKLSKLWKLVNQPAIYELRHLKVLDLSRNDLTSLSKTLFQRMKDLKELNLAGNNLTVLDNSIFLSNLQLEMLDLSGDSLLEFNVQSVRHLRKLETLRLEDNSIATFSPRIIAYADHPSNNLTTLGLIGNPFQCRCDQDFLQNWIKETDKVPFANQLECNGPTLELRYQKVYAYERNTYFCDHREQVVVALSILGSVIATLLIALPCYKYHWYISHARVVIRAIANQISTVRFEQRCTYDAYIMYNSASDEDLSWIVDKLLLALEKEELSLSSEKVSVLKLNTNAFRWLFGCIAMNLICCVINLPMQSARVNAR